MKRTIAYAAAIAFMTATAGTAIAKDHTMPADTADAFGQPRADETYKVGGEIAKVAAKAGTLEGDKIATAAQTFEREPASPPKGKPVKPD